MHSENRIDKDTAREAFADDANLLGIEGIEYIEYVTAKPQALGQVLEQMGFRPTVQRRSVALPGQMQLRAL
jgi:4-hydroxyphenylpyruvate dioxygenase